MSRKTRRHRQRYSEGGWSRQDREPLWDEAEGSREDLDDGDWDHDESWEEPEGFWEDSDDDRVFAGEAGARSRDPGSWDWESRAWRDVLDKEG